MTTGHETTPSNAAKRMITLASWLLLVTVLGCGGNSISGQDDIPDVTTGNQPAAVPQGESANENSSTTAGPTINLVQAKRVSSSWHQWRGPRRDGVSDETGLLDSWSSDGPPLAWRVQGLGSGMSSVSIANDRIFTMGHKQGRAHIVCRKLPDGSDVWSTPIGGNEPNCTPTVDPDARLVFGLTYSGELACVEADSGTMLWQKSFERDFGGKMMSGWGYSESPLVDGDRLICTPGALDAMIVALDKRTGRTIWKASQPADVGRGGAEGAGYSSIVVSHAAGVKQYVQLTGRGLISVAADDGRTLWTYNRVANNVANVPTPVVRGDSVFSSSGYGVGSGLVKVTRQGEELRADEVYFLGGNRLQNHHGGMVLLGDHVYMGHGHGNGFPVCVEFATGNIVWGGRIRGAGSGSAAVVCADGHLYFRYEDGVMALIEASPEEYKLKGSFRIGSHNGKSWPHPVIHGGRLYLRDQDELLCYDIRAHSETAIPAEATPVSMPFPKAAETSTPSDPELTPPVADISSRPTDWPRFRGPTGQGVSTEVGLPLEWSATKNIIWKVPLPGPGASSPVIRGDRVYVTCYSGYGVNAEAPGNPADLTRHLVCLNRSNGRIVWNETVASRVTEQPFSDSLARHGHASSTPVLDQDGICVYFGASRPAEESSSAATAFCTALGRTHDELPHVTRAIEYIAAVVVADQ